MLLPRDSRSRSILILFAIAALALAVFVPSLRVVGVMFGGIAMCLVATGASHATRVGHVLAPMIGRRFRVRVWQQPLPEAGADIVELIDVHALGAGLLLRLRVPDTQRNAWLKLAQPSDLVRDDHKIAVRFNGYVSWDGTRIKGPDGQRAPGDAAFELLP